MTRPCSLCGQPRAVVAKSKLEVVCHECRRKRGRPPINRERVRRQNREAAARARATGKRIGANYRARARHYGVQYEPIQPRRVFARDGWRCGICGRKVDKRLKAPNPMRASLDHIVPMSKGGDHLLANVQCAHLRCNVGKRERGGGEQLALVG